MEKRPERLLKGFVFDGQASLRQDSFGAEKIGKKDDHGQRSSQKGKGIDTEQGTCVLATSAKNQPHCSLMAYACNEKSGRS